MSYDRLKHQVQHLGEEIEATCLTTQRIDSTEDDRYGADQRDALPEELQQKQARLEKIQAAKARLEAAQRAHDDARGRHPNDRRRPPGG